MRRWIRRLLIGILGLFALWCATGLTLALLPASGFVSEGRTDPAPDARVAGRQPTDSASVVAFEVAAWAESSAVLRRLGDDLTGRRAEAVSGFLKDVEGFEAEG